MTEIAEPTWAMADGVAHASEEEKQEEESQRRWISILIACTILSTALGALLLGVTSARAAGARERGQRFGREATERLLEGRRTGEAEYFRYILQRAIGHRAGIEDWVASSGDARTRTDLHDAWLRVAQRSLAGPGDHDLSAESPIGPLHDANFPTAFLAKQTRAANVAEAKLDAANDASERWLELTGRISALLTAFAACLFLFGKSLALAGGTRKTLVAFGLVMLVVGVAWMGVLAVQTVQTHDDGGGETNRAAQRYADGTEALARGDMPEAINDFSAAIRMQPGFAAAYRGRAEAELTSGNEQVGSGFQSNAVPESQRRATHDLEDARREGLIEYQGQDLSGDLAFFEYRLWLGDRTGTLDRARSLARDAADRAPTAPIPQLNLGLIELAAGDREAASAAYQRGADDIRFEDGSRRKRARPSELSQVQEQWLAGALTDLDNLGTYQPGLRQQTERQKDRLVTRVVGVRTLSATEIGKPRIVAVTPTSATLDLPIAAAASAPPVTGRRQMSAQPTQPTPSPMTDRLAGSLSIQWYQRPVSNDAASNRRRRPWSVIADISGWGSRPPFSLTGAAGGYRSVGTFGGRSLAGCLVDGTRREYRAEIYVNGRHTSALTKTVKARTRRFFPTSAQDLQIGLCIPQNWEQDSELFKTEYAGIVTAFKPKHGSEGAVFWRVPVTRRFLRAAGNASVLVRSVRDVSLESMRHAGILPASLQSRRELGSDYLGLGSATTELMSSEPGGIGALVGAGITKDDHTVIIDLVYGNAAQLEREDSDLQQVFQSAVHLAG